RTTRGGSERGLSLLVPQPTKKAAAKRVSASSAAKTANPSLRVIRHQYRSSGVPWKGFTGRHFHHSPATPDLPETILSVSTPRPTRLSQRRRVFRLLAAATCSQF